ncbi:AAA family ATPase [Microcoleus sp. FACHB-SPT15]|uniref:AAA family ATPase n=1 Tax=Microcoleus sp. FACHB-SPT15 TaxID=2692830 RepID=UPI0017811C98|nr:AAA family ATPase [Microcoleus sp. FACHB-SPT15]MBD1808617.1 AAA family ATPase [Microcoleus sp. FACHB-SPT15]
MKVKRLKIQSFRGFDDLTLEFPPDEPTVLIGINGVGKSSILDCITILLSLYEGLLLFPPTNPKHKKSRQEKKRKDKDRNYFFDAISAREEDIKNGYQETHNEITVLLNSSQEVTWSFTTNREEGTELDWKMLQEAVTDMYPDLEDTTQVNIPVNMYYIVHRAVLDIPLAIPKEYSFEQINTYGSDLPEFIQQASMGFDNFFKWFRSVEDLENEERRDNPSYRNNRLDAVRQSIYSLLGEEFSNLRVRRSPLRMTINKQGQELIVNQLSDGEKCLLAMVGDLARRLAITNSSLPDPLQGSGVVLIDEIELHLHPKWQREIIPALTRTFPNCQFIVTTHSPQVISQVKPEGIYILERTDDGIVAMRPESSYGRDSNRILEDLMDTPERPQEIKESLLELFRLIARGDLDSARQLHQKIADEIGADEPELVGASVSIRRREILGR